MIKRKEFLFLNKERKFIEFIKNTPNDPNSGKQHQLVLSLDHPENSSLSNILSFPDDLQLINEAQTGNFSCNKF